MKTSIRSGYKEKDYRNFWRSPYYMAELTTLCTIEISRYLQEMDNDLTSIEEFSEFLREEHYHPSRLILYNSLRKISEKKESEADKKSQFYLDLRLLSSELSDIQNLPREKLEVLIEFCCDVSEGFRHQAWLNSSRRHVA